MDFIVATLSLPIDSHSIPASFIRFLVYIVKKPFSPPLPHQKDQIHKHEEPDDSNGNQILSNEINSIVRLHSSTANQNRNFLSEEEEYTDE